MSSMFAIAAAILVPTALLIAFILTSRRANYTTPISKIHAGKARHHLRKFDLEIVKRRPLAFTGPVIDVSNLPPPDPQVVKVMQALTEADVERVLRELSGETEVTVRGTKMKILSRSTFAPGLEHSMQYLEDFYAGLGIKCQRHKYVKRGTTLYNLEATIPGTVNPDKIFIFGAHLDSTAGDQSDAEDRAPGCDDNLTGIVANMRIALAILALIKAGYKLGCTVRILHFTGEEQGLWGSYTYSDKVAKEKINLDSMIQTDMIGYCNKPGNRVDLHDDRDRNGSHRIVEVLVRAVARYKLNLTPVDTHDHAVHNRSDNAGFLDHGYQAVLVSEEYSEDGFNPNYHSVKDDINAINLPYTVEVMRMLIAGIVDLIELK